MRWIGGGMHAQSLWIACDLGWSGLGRGFSSAMGEFFGTDRHRSHCLEASFWKTF